LFGCPLTSSVAGTLPVARRLNVLAQFQEEKKILLLSVKSLGELKEEVGRAFDLGGNLKLQYFNTIYKEYVCLESIDVLPMEGAKLWITTSSSCTMM